MAKITALEKFFKTHKRSCTVHIYSGDRHCSCGRDEAWQEVLRLQYLSQPTQRPADDATGCAHRAPRVIGVGLFICDDCGKTLRR
jgi:hypothetical protein